jgi:hypothetical protein
MIICRGTNDTHRQLLTSLFRDSGISSHSKELVLHQVQRWHPPTCKTNHFEELTVFHLLPFMGKKGFENGIGVMLAEERVAAGKKGYENGLGVMLAEKRMSAGKKWYENGIGKMSAEERTDKWDEQYAAFKNYVKMPKSTSMLYKWQQNQLSRFDAKIKKEIAENKEGTTWSDRRTRLLACIAKKENDNCEEQYAAFVNYVGMPKSRSAL